MTAYPDHSLCGACGYSTQGLASFTCPECGNDLRRVGIVSRRRRETVARRRRGRFDLLGSAVVLALVIYIAVSLLRDAVTPLVWTPREYEERHYLKLPVATRTFYIVGTARTWTDLRPTLAVRIEMYQPGQQAPATLRLSGNRVTDRECLEWMQGAGVGENDPRAGMEAAEIVQIVPQVSRPTQLLARGDFQRTSQSPLGATGRRSSVASGAPPQTVTWLLTPVGVLVWLASLYFLWKNRASGQPFTSQAARE